MPVDLSQSGYNAGRGVARMERNDSVERAVKGGMGLLSNVTSFAVSLDEGIKNADFSKMDEFTRKRLWGNSTSGTQGDLDLFTSSTLDYDSFEEGCLEIKDQILNADFLSKELGVSRRNAERFIEERGDEYSYEVTRYAEQMATRSKQVQLNNTMNATRQYYAADTSLSADEAFAKYKAAYEESNPESWDFSGEQNPENPDNKIAFYSGQAAARGDAVIKDLTRTTDMTSSQIIEAALAPMNEYLSQADFGDDAEANVLVGLSKESVTNHLSDMVKTESATAIADADALLAQGSEYLLDMWNENPEYQMSDEQFEDFIINTLGMDPDNNPRDRRNAQSLYEIMRGYNTAAGNAMVTAWKSDPENWKAFTSAMNESIQNRAEGGTVHRRTYTISGSDVTVRDEAGEIISGTYMPTYEEQEYTPSSAALDTIITNFNNNLRRSGSAETIIPTDFGDVVDQIPAEIRNNPEAFEAAINEINTYGKEQVNLYSESMKNKAIEVATNTSLSQLEKRNKLAQMLASKEIDMNAYNDAIGKVSFAYEEDRIAVSNILKSSLYAMTGDNELYNEIVADPGFQDRLERWILGLRTVGGTLQSANPQQFVDQQIGFFIASDISKQMADDSARSLREIFDTDILLGNSYAFSVSDPGQLKKMAEDGGLSLVMDSGAIRNMRQQIALGDSTLTLSMDDIRENGARFMFGSSYEDLTDYQRGRVDINAALAVGDQFDFEMLHDTFITGQGLDSYAEVAIKTGDSTTVGVLGSDGFVYFLPNYTYNDTQAASFFYVGTNSDVYKNAMSGDDVTLSLAGYNLGNYTRPSAEELAERSSRNRPAEGPKSLSDWKDYIKINPSTSWRGADQSVSIDTRLWDVVNEDNIDELLAIVGRDPNYKQFYNQIQQGWADHMTYGYDYDQQTYEAPERPEITLGENVPAFEYKLSEDLDFLVEKDNVRSIYQRINNA